MPDDLKRAIMHALRQLPAVKTAGTQTTRPAVHDLDLAATIVAKAVVGFIERDAFVLSFDDRGRLERDLFELIQKVDELKPSGSTFAERRRIDDIFVGALALLERKEAR